MEGARSGAGDAGLRLIVGYKLVKGAGEVLLAALLVAVGGSWGLSLAVALRQHVAGVWSLKLAELLVATDRSHAIELVIYGLLFDGLLTLSEGWALYRRFIWAPWLVVVATGSLLPFEVFELLHRASLARLLIVLINVSVVWYLAARVVRRPAGAA